MRDAQTKPLIEIFDEEMLGMSASPHTVLELPMALIQSLPGFAALGWTRIQGARLPVLLFKSCVVLAGALTALRMFSLG